MSWKTNIYNENVNYKARIYISDTILENTLFSTDDSGLNYIFSGNSINLGITQIQFNTNNNVRLLLNGVELDKNTDINWISNNSFSLTLDIDKDDIIIIYG